MWLLALLLLTEEVKGHGLCSGTNLVTTSQLCDC